MVCRHYDGSIYVTEKERPYLVQVYTKSESLPPLLDGNFFHSRELFCILEKTPGSTPCMAVASSPDGGVVGQLLFSVHHRHSWLPPYLYKHAHAHEEGVYADGVDREEVFGAMASAVTRMLDSHLCLYIEFSGIRKKMFGYRHLRQQGYFPIVWQEVHNSLHSMPPRDRLDGKTLRRIDRLASKGVVTREVSDMADVHAFHGLLKRYYRFKPRRYIPDERYFEEMLSSRHSGMFLTEWHGIVIGCCACIYCGGNAYLWYLASKRKSYAALHPDLMSVWHAIDDAYRRGFAHIYFMDVGLPWFKNPFRNFILGFGGKPVAKYRWFRFCNRFLNKILMWLYRDR